jgi:hypothetical protein
VSIEGLSSATASPVICDFLAFTLLSLSRLHESPIIVNPKRERAVDDKKEKPNES